MNTRNTILTPLPLVSVLMAVYNSSEYLMLAINSVINQTYQNLEVIIVNDGSTDNSYQIINSFKDPRIIYIENETNLGIVKSRNRGLERASGKYLAILDSDDIANPERITRQVEFLEKNTDYGLCGTHFSIINKYGEKVSKIEFPQKDDEIRAYLHLGNCFCHSTVCVRTELVKQFRYSEATVLGEDYQLFIDISSVSKLANLPFIGGQYRVHPKNISLEKSIEMFASINEINRQNLIKLNIPFSDSQLLTHSNLLIFNAEYFREDTAFNELENWVKTLINATNKDTGMNKDVIFKFLVHRWFVICYKRKKMKKVLFTNLLSTYKLKYLTLMISEALGHSTNKYLRKMGKVSL